MACRVLVLAEHEGGAVRDTTLELLGMAHRLAAEAGGGAADVKAVLIGDGLDALAQGLAARGAAEVICAEGAAVGPFTSDGHARALEPLLKSETPDIVLIGHTPNGWDVAPLLAAGLGGPIATEGSQIAYEAGRPLFTPKAFNGKVIQGVHLG